MVLIYFVYRFNMALYCNLKLNMFVVAACLNTNSDGARKLLEQCNPKHFLLVELDIRKSASILHIEKTIINLLASDNTLGKVHFYHKLNSIHFDSSINIFILKYFQSSAIW